MLLDSTKGAPDSSCRQFGSGIPRQSSSRGEAMEATELQAGARDAALSRAIFAGAAVMATPIAVFGSTLIRSERLLGSVLFLLCISLTCAAKGMAPSYTIVQARRRWLVGASLCFALALILGALAPLAG